MNIIELQYEFGSAQGLIEAGLDWLLSNVQQELAFTLGLTTAEDFVLYIVEDGQTPLKLFIQLTFISIQLALLNEFQIV